MYYVIYYFPDGSTLKATDNACPNQGEYVYARKAYYVVTHKIFKWESTPMIIILLTECTGFDIEWINCEIAASF